MIPFRYNLRNLRVRYVTTVLTVVGTGLVVWAACFTFGLVDGLERSLNVSGDPLDLIVFRKGSTTETNSGIDESKAQDVANLAGIARDDSGRPLVSTELINIPVMQRVDGSRANMTIRGVQAAAPKLRSQFQIVAGRMFEPGRGECIVSRTLARRFQGAALGGELRVSAKESYRVVGLFTANGGAAESEVWVDFKDLAKNIGREGSASSVQLRAASGPEMLKIRDTLKNDTQFKLDALPESEYFAGQTRSSIFLKVFGGIIAVFLTVGAMFGAANTMYSAVSARTREIGTMRALGFSRTDVLISFLGESIVLCILGGILGLLLTIPLSTMDFGINDNFVERTIRFRMGSRVMASALLMTTAMGLFGGLFPALRAVKLDVIKALREL